MRQARRGCAWAVVLLVKPITRQRRRWFRLKPKLRPRAGSCSWAQALLLQPDGKPVRQPGVHQAADIDLRRRYALLSQRQIDADPVGEPQMRIGETAQLVPVMFRRLIVARLPDL